MKKTFVCALALCLVFVSGVFAASGITLIVNGQKADVDVKVIDGVTYLPLRAVGELLNIPVNYDGVTKTITVGSNSGSGTTVAPTTASKYEFTVQDSNGKELYSFKINKIQATDDRNPYSDKNPAQILIIDYTYTNIANPEELFLSELNFKIIDSSGTIGYTYPANINDYPQKIPTGATCNAQMAFGIDHASKNVKVNFYTNIFDSSATKSFTIPITEY